MRFSFRDSPRRHFSLLSTSCLIVWRSSFDHVYLRLKAERLEKSDGGGAFISRGLMRGEAFNVFSPRTDGVPGLPRERRNQGISMLAVPGAGTPRQSEYPLLLSYPAGLARDYVVRVPLDEFGIHNFYLTVRFRPTDATPIAPDLSAQRFDRGNGQAPGLYRQIRSRRAPAQQHCFSNIHRLKPCHRSANRLAVSCLKFSEGSK